MVVHISLDEVGQKGVEIGGQFLLMGLHGAGVVHDEQDIDLTRFELVEDIPTLFENVLVLRAARAEAEKQESQGLREGAVHKGWFHSCPSGATYRVMQAWATVEGV